jgi:hypothetical protein
MSLRAVICVLLTLPLAACAPRHVVWSRSHLGPDAPRPARVEFSPGLANAVFNRAVRSLRSHGFAPETCENTHVVTRAVELDAPCGRSTCLARQAVRVDVGHYVAKLRLIREVWDPAAKRWVEPTDDAAVRSIERDTEELMQELLGRHVPDGLRRDVAATSCTRLPCSGAACIASR